MLRGVQIPNTQMLARNLTALNIAQSLHFQLWGAWTFEEISKLPYLPGKCKVRAKALSATRVVCPSDQSWVEMEGLGLRV